MGSYEPPYFELQPRKTLPPPTPLQVHVHVHDTSFPILAISIVGMLTTALLLLSYYIFVTKCCCLSWHNPDILLLRRLSRSRRNRLIDDRLRSVYSTTTDREGLDESVIQSIPTLRFRHSDSSFHDCAVCLNEFQEQEKIRMLPNCYHIFHIDCIDTWLQSHSNCPICRADITTTATIRPIPIAQHPNSLIGSGDSVVIEVRDDDDDDDSSSDQETEESKKKKKKKKKLLHKVVSVGDECIDLREKDKEFNDVQPMRRSFSMDSMGDRQLYMAVQEILQQNPHFRQLVKTTTTGSNDDGSSSSSSSSSSNSSSGRVRRSFFSLGRGI